MPFQLQVTRIPAGWPDPEWMLRLWLPHLECPSLRPKRWNWDAVETPGNQPGRGSNAYEIYLEGRAVVLEIPFQLPVLQQEKQGSQNTQLGQLPH